MTVLTPAQLASLTRAVTRRSHGQVSVPQVRIERAEAIGLWQDAAASFAPSTSRLLTQRELVQLRRRAWRESAGHAALSEEAMLLANAMAFWRLSCRLGDLAARRQSPVLVRVAGAAALGLAATQLAACTSLFGGNIKGSFACSAPGGTCAPSTLIDDQALLVIQNARPMTPGQSGAGPYIRQPAAARATTASYTPAGEGRIANAGNGMVHRERRVLKVVFPSFVDGGGNLHEPRIVHAVVDDGAWMQLSSGEPNLGEQVEGRAISLASDAAAIPEAVAAQPVPAMAVPSLPVPVPAGPPSPDAVAAARAKGAALKAGNAIDAIRAEVQVRLAQTVKAPGGTPAMPVAPASTAQRLPPVSAPPAAAKTAVPANPPTAFPAKVEE